jgi:hypothetical protein
MLALQFLLLGSLPVDQDFGEDAISGIAIEDLLDFGRPGSSVLHG